MAEARRGDRKFAPLPPDVVKVRAEGDSARGLVDYLLTMPGLKVVTGPDEYPGGRLYLTVTVSGEDAQDD